MAKNIGEAPSATSKKNDTQVFNHNCVNVGQDKLHGKNNRVFNLGVKGWKCTVCKGLR